MTDDKMRLTGTLGLPAGRVRETMQTQNGVKAVLAARARSVKQPVVKQDNRIWSMKH